MTRSMICGIVIVLVTSTFFSGCLTDDDDDKENGFNIQDSIVTGPFLNDLDDDQTFIGGFTNEAGEFFHIYFEHVDSPFFDDEDFIYSYNNMTGETELLFSDSEIRGWDLNGKHLMFYHVHPTTPGPDSVS